MSQMGVEGNGDSDTNFSMWNLPNDFYNSEDTDERFPFDLDSSESNAKRVTVLLIFSVIGLLGNFLTILLVLVTKQLQKPNNSFFIHQCILDMIKSTYCCIFSKSLLNREPPSDCAILGASFIVFVTTSAFNILAITINEIYYFTNEVVGTQSSSKCCVLFGLGITWFASIIINLGVAFLPGNSSFDRAVGYCTFMYGVTGNYLLHVLWIALITLSLLLTIIYLRKFWTDIRKRAYHRIATVFQHRLRTQYEVGASREKAKLREEYIQKTIGVGKKNFFVLLTMIILFIALWYPLFILTLADPLFKADPRFYKTLTIVAWCHSSLTPVFFLAYNISSIKDLQEKIIWKPERQPSTHSFGTPSPRTYQLTSDSGSTPCSPQRPSSLNVTPVYHCHHHLSSGTCIEDDCSTGTRTEAEGNQAATTPQLFNKHKLASGTLSNDYTCKEMSRLLLSLDRNTTATIEDDIWSKRANYEATSENGGKVENGCSKNGFEMRESTLDSGISHILEFDLPSKSVSRTSSRSARISVTTPLIDKNGNYLNNRPIIRRLVHSSSLTIPSNNMAASHFTIPRVITVPQQMASADHMTQPSSDMEVQVDKQTIPSYQLTVHRASTGSITTAKEPAGTDWV